MCIGMEFHNLGPRTEKHLSPYIFLDNVAFYEGNDVETVFQMKEAFESNGGISGVKVFICASQEQTEEDTTSTESISQLTDFEYVVEGI